jgi:hypothetical protein
MADRPVGLTFYNGFARIARLAGLSEELSMF